MVEVVERVDRLVSEGVKRIPRSGWFEFPADVKIRWAFEAGLPDPATFPLEDIERLTADVLHDEASDALQYGSPGSNGWNKARIGLSIALTSLTMKSEWRTESRRFCCSGSSCAPPMGFDAAPIS